MTHPVRPGSRWPVVWRGLLLTAAAVAIWIGVQIYRFEPARTIHIQNCGAREYFRQQLDGANINYKRLPNGDFHFDAQAEMDKLDVLQKGENFLEIPDWANSRDWKRCEDG